MAGMGSFTFLCCHGIELIPGTEKALSKNLCIDCWRHVRTSLATFLECSVAAAVPIAEEYYHRKSHRQPEAISLLETASLVSKLCRIQFSHALV